MTPSHVRKKGVKYRYYISSALLQGRAKQAGTVSRIPADEIEALIAKSVRGHLNAPADIDDAVLVHTHVVRVKVQSDQLVIELANANGSDRRQKRSRDVIEVPWRKTLSIRRREILFPQSAQPKNARPIRSENRALLVASIARGRRWLNELISDPAATTESIAGREGSMGQWCRCATAEHPFMPVRISFHRLSRGVRPVAPWIAPSTLE
jgi:hypothetical protein